MDKTQINPAVDTNANIPNLKSATVRAALYVLSNT